LSRIYRILRRPYAKAAFDGEGAYRFGGRWSSQGTRLTYTSEHLSLAMLEYFVHIDPDYPPKDLMQATADVPDTVPRIILKEKQLPENWRRTPAPPELAGIGNEFVQNGRAAVLIVPSALATAESNWLINPMHPAFSRIKLNPAEAFAYDSRSFRS
jgi:RES domain-containing protein